jgi:hypothetical protein
LLLRRRLVTTVRFMLRDRRGALCFDLFFCRYYLLDKATC